MKKYIFFLMGVVCFLLSSLAAHANELNKSDANIIGHVLDESTKTPLFYLLFTTNVTLTTGNNVIHREKLTRHRISYPIVVNFKQILDTLR